MTRPVRHHSYTEDRVQYLGTASRAGSHEAHVITSIEQLVGSGDTVVTFGRVVTGYGDGWGQVRDEEAVRLTAAEREDLIRRLSDHRIADIADLINTT